MDDEKTNESKKYGRIKSDGNAYIFDDRYYNQANLNKTNHELTYIKHDFINYTTRRKFKEARVAAKLEETRAIEPIRTETKTQKKPIVIEIKSKPTMEHEHNHHHHHNHHCENHLHDCKHDLYQHNSHQCEHNSHVHHHCNHHNHQELSNYGDNMHNMHLHPKFDYSYSNNFY